MTWIDACFTHSLNDGEVLVNYHYSLNDPECNEITSIEMLPAGKDPVDVTSIVHPHDYEWFVGLLTEKATEHATDMAADAADERREARREEMA